MKITLQEVSLLQVRILSEFKKYVAGKKNDMEHGVETPEIAAMKVENYGYGLAKALAMAEDLLEAPKSDLMLLVDRLVLEINPNVGEEQKKRSASEPAG